MRILHLSPTLPWPADGGGKIVIWNHLRADARHSQVGLLSFSDGPPDSDTLQAIGTVCGAVEAIRRPRSLDGVVGGARSLITTTAMNLAKYRWPVFSEALQRFVNRWKPDVVVAHHLHMAPYLDEIHGPVRILREHNVDSDLMARYAATLRNPAMAAFARRQVEQIRETERRLLPKMDECLAITRHDEQKLLALAPEANLSVLPGAIDMKDYPLVDPPRGGADPLIVAAGSLHFRPTGEGVVEFVELVWPRIRRALPRARLRIIGHAPETLRRRLARGEGVELTGRVPEMRPHLQGAGAFVVPLRVGSGMRIRILESLAWGLPTVSTSIGCEGIEVENARQILVADAVDAMASAVVRIFREPVVAGTLRREGHRLIEKRYSLEAFEQQTLRLYQRALARRNGLGDAAPAVVEVGGDGEAAEWPREIR